MSAATETLSTQESSTSLWLRQIAAIVRLELEKNFFGRRSFLIYLIAVLPLLPLLIVALILPPSNE